MNQSLISFRSGLKAILLWMAVTVQVLAAQEQDFPTLFGVSEKLIGQWGEITRLGGNDPNAALAQARDLRSKIDSSQPNATQQLLYARYIELELMLLLEQNKQVLEASKQGLKLAESVPQVIYQAKLLNVKAAAHKALSQYVEGLRESEKALKIFADLRLEKEVAETHELRGQLLANRSSFSDALKEYYLAYEIFQRVGNKTNIASVLSSIAICYNETEQPEKALEYYQLALENIDRESQKFYASIVIYNIGTVYEKLEQFPKALEYFGESLAISEVLNDDVGKAYTWWKMGAVYVKQERFERASSLLEKALPILEKAGEKRTMINASVTLAQAYTGQDKFADANRLLAAALEMESLLPSSDHKLFIFRSAAEIYESQNRLSEALSMRKAYIVEMEAGFERKQKSRVSELKAKFDSDFTEAQNELLKKDNQLKAAELEQQKTHQQLMIALTIMSVLVVLAITLNMLRQVKMRKRFAVLAMTDELTQAPNRRHILEYADTQFHVAKDTGMPLVVAMLDIDHFKRVNDQFGHDIGDKVLQRFYQAASTKIRSVDRLGRMGGEEWLLVMPGQELEQIDRIFQRIANATRDCLKTLAGESEPITFSMGVARLESDEDLQQLINRADNAVYLAKQSGRNRFEISNAFVGIS